MAELRRGDIVKVEVVDPQHRNPKVRPVIILNPSEDIDAEMELAAVAITGTVPDPLPDSFVLLPYHPRGHPRTGLQKRSAAVCDWFLGFAKDDIVRRVGRVPDKQLRLILEKVGPLPRRPPEFDDE
ncbi:MAG TPA: type II toxin-antitoxin system PemK/MazF family toxin [Gemmataceae bacterium]|nr:type II toxin-antitoxin system PemK/MazF family toxin [Gemmataceae bacterium]